MTPSEEDFVHYVECIQSLNRAWSILQELATIEHPSLLHGAAFRYALVEYAKPYTRSDGDHARRTLPPPTLSAELLSTHHQILSLRHQVLAHTDITIKQAQLHIHSAAGKPYHIIASELV